MSHSPPDTNEPWLTSAAYWPLSRILELKNLTRVAVVIPARDEERTIGGVVESIIDELDEVIDEVIVMDSLSHDETARIATAAGARVHSVADVRPDLGIRAGKGEAIWKSQFVTNSDITAFIDADLTEWGPHFVRGVIGPLLENQHVQLCRGFYDRLLDTGSSVTLEGGRVTELVARPWLALFRPELSGMVQPLAGEWAIRGSALRSLSLPTGYGVEISTLLDIHATYGIQAIAQVDLGRRAHRHQSIHDLGAMAVEVLAAANRRRFTSETEQDPEVALLCEELPPTEVSLRSMDEERQWSERRILTDERSPFETVSGHPRQLPH